MDNRQNAQEINSDGILGMTGSYNSSSYSQLAGIQSSITYIEQAVHVLDIIPSSSPIILADFGCAHGANSQYIMKIIIELIQQIKKIERTFLVIHNDLPTNDWSSLFNILLEDKSYFGVGNGHSFYEQCLPSNSVTMSYSSAAIHWLSRKPCNISNHCVSDFAHGKELEAFKTQAQLDYIQFLEHRSRELLPGGILILGIHCSDKNGKTMLRYGYDLLYRCAQLLPLNDEELLDYTFPAHRRSYEEYFNEEIFNRCSFQLITSVDCLTKSSVYEQYQQGQLTLEQFAEKVTNSTRSWSESQLKQTLQHNEKRSKDQIDQMLERFWSLYKEELKKTPDQHNRSSYQNFLVLKKI